ncbi:hypothetical protein ACFOWZ_05790 [Lentzea rhizosphaerae]|uniref:Uncharacterized protein n=1 Tax=Lentzea rhizosphaerae TaxID=2041025 RepID=A0ABV8BN05_9PSEU
MGDAWGDFRGEVFGDPYLVWHEGADVGALIAEHGREPERAERRPITGPLLSRIDGVGDREGAVRLRVDEIVAVLEKAADVLTAGT